MFARQTIRPMMSLLLALPLVLLGLILHANWKGSLFPMPILWACLSVLLLLAGCHAGVRAAVARFARRYLSSPWLWLAVAVALAVLGMFGVAQLGARRYLGDVVMLRSGLWAMPAFLAFLAMYAQQPSPGLVRHAVAALGSGLMVFALILQPDLFVVGLTGVLAIFVALHARNAMRWVVPAGVVGVGVALLLVMMASLYRLQRVMAAFDAAYQDPFAQGWVAHVQAQAQALAGAFHGGGESAARWLARLPVDGPLFAPAHITQWGGFAALVGVAALLLGIAAVLWRQVSAASPDIRALVRAGSLAQVVTTLWVYAVFLFHWAFSDGFGLAFVTGEFGCLMSLLALAAAASTEPTPHTKSEGATP